MRRYTLAAAAVLAASLPLALGTTAGAQTQARRHRAAGGMSGVRGVKETVFGRLKDGSVIHLYTLTNSHGLVAKVMTYGAILTELHVPDRHGKMGDIVLGFDNLAQYEKGDPYFGATVGRVANRIAKGRFTLDGKTYKLAVNNGPNSLHGGLKGFDKRIWAAEPAKNGAGPSVVFHYTSPDGEEGYPGTVRVSVRYTLTDANELRLDYMASTDKDTPINLTNHSYFNLATEGEVRDNVAQFAADKYTPTDNTLIPTGEIKSVAGTPLDFRKPKKIGAQIDEMPDYMGGYDNNFVINKSRSAPAFFARVSDPESGRVLEGFTTEPGFQFYTGNFLDGSLTGKRGITYNKHDAFCLEAQHYPDSIHHPNFPSSVLHPGETYRQTTIYRFTTEK